MEKLDLIIRSYDDLRQTMDAISNREFAKAERKCILALVTIRSIKLMESDKHGKESKEVQS